MSLISSSDQERLRETFRELPRPVRKAHLELALDQLQTAIQRGARTAVVYSELGAVLEHVHDRSRPEQAMFYCRDPQTAVERGPYKKPARSWGDAASPEVGHQVRKIADQQPAMMTPAWTPVSWSCSLIKPRGGNFWPRCQATFSRSCAGVNVGASSTA